jgi:uncharacterized membrane protein
MADAAGPGWLLKSVVWPVKGRSPTEPPAELEEACADGWEPFGVLRVSDGREIWLRRLNWPKQAPPTAH